MHVHDDTTTCSDLSPSIHYDKMRVIAPFYNAARDSDDSLIVADVPPWSESLDIPLFHGLVHHEAYLQSGETDFLRDILDCTSLATSFDHSCLRYLDLQLLTRPAESFADVCWTDAVHDDDSNERCSLSSSISDSPTSSPSYPPSSVSEEDSISSSSESTTCHKGDDGCKQSYPDRYWRQVYPPAAQPGKRDSFLFSASSRLFASSNPAESVCNFPTMAPAPRAREKSYHRFADFCLKLPCLVRRRN